MEQQYKNEMYKTLDSLLSCNAFNGKKVFLFGHCNATEEMANYLLLKSITPNSILDNSPLKQGGNYHGIVIESPNAIKHFSTSDSIVLIATRFYEEMRSQLRNLGYTGEVIQVIIFNSFAEHSLSDNTIKRKMKRMEQGIRTLKRIREHYPAAHLVICPNKALGDVYWAMSFLSAYSEKNHIGKTAIIVIGNACRQVAELFGATDITVLENKEMDELVQAVIYTREGNSIIAHHDRPYTDNIIKWLDKHFLSFIDYYRCAVYGLAKDTPPIQPHKFENYKNQEQMPKGKSVILSPYAKSVIVMASGFWEKIADDYLAKGFSVYTNVVDEELPINRTLPLNISISQMLSAVEYAGTFIGIRSGLCDVLNTANCRKIVAFPDCFYSTTPHKVADFFALPGWETIDLS